MTELSEDCGEAATFVMSEHIRNHFLCEGGFFFFCHPAEICVTTLQERKKRHV